MLNFDCSPVSGLVSPVMRTANGCTASSTRSISAGVLTCAPRSAIMASSAGRDRAERAGEMPAAGVMTGRRLADPHPGLETCRIGADDIAPADAAKLDQRQQRGEHRPAGMQHDAAHVG